MFGPERGPGSRLTAEPRPEAGLALGYLIVFGSLLGYSTYECLLPHASSQLAGTYAFVCPLVAVILGWWLLGEQISGHTLLAAAAIALIMLHPGNHNQSGTKQVTSAGNHRSRRLAAARSRLAEDLPAGHGIRDQSSRLWQVMECLGEDLADRIDVGWASGDHGYSRLASIWAAGAAHRTLRL